MSKTEYVYTTGTVGTATKVYNYTYGNTWKDQLTSFDGTARVLHTNLYYKILNFSMITSYVIGGKEGVEWLLVTYQKELGGLK